VAARGIRNEEEEAREKRLSRSRGHRQRCWCRRKVEQAERNNMNRDVAVAGNVVCFLLGTKINEMAGRQRKERREEEKRFPEGLCGAVSRNQWLFSLWNRKVSIERVQQWEGAP